MKNNVLIISVLCWCILNKIEAQKVNFSSSDSFRVNQMMINMTLKEKIGQLFILNIFPTNEDVDRKNEILSYIDRYNLGGIILMKGNYSKAVNIVNELQQRAKTPLFVAIDGEWGISMRINSAIKFPYELTLGAIQNDTLIYEMGQAIGKECKDIGVNINFAPVVDVNINPNNPVINYRSFGENKNNVAYKGLNLALGMQSEGVMACLKHYPGHGDTDVDSHFDLPNITKSKSELDSIELYPFRHLLARNIWSVMTAHLKVPALDSTGLPSSISKPMIDYLRKDLKFNGLIITDALNMKGVASNATNGEVELKAYQAGNDILEFSTHFEEAVSKIESYVTSKNDLLQEFNLRIQKILLYKVFLKLDNAKSHNSQNLYNTNSTDNPHYQLVEKLYQESITLLSPNERITDEIRSQNTKILFLSIGDPSTTIRTKMDKLQNVTSIYIPKNSKDASIRHIIEKSKKYDWVIVSYHGLSQQSKSNFGLESSQFQLIQNLNTLPNVLHLWFGNPYGLKFFQYSDNIMVGYEDNTFTQNAVFNYLTQPIPIPGRLPVSVGKFKEMGHHYVSLETAENKTQLVDSAIDSTLYKSSPVSEYEIDAMCYDMIAKGVTPGCQLVVRHKGREIYNKCFGHHSYSLTSPKVTKTDVYDLASMTKILATTLAVMRLKEWNMIQLDDKVMDYLDLDSTNTIGHITIRQLLVHEAGLTPFIPFYTKFNESNFYQYFSNIKSPTHPTEVAANMYLIDGYKDTMWQTMSHRSLHNMGTYKYSDLSMYILQRVVESISKISLDTFVINAFYKPLNLGLTYHPLSQYPLQKIVPTEYDLFF